MPLQAPTVALGELVLDTFRELGPRSPRAGAGLILSLLSLAGIPALAGFAGKVFLLSAAIEGGMGWLGFSRPPT